MLIGMIMYHIMPSQTMFDLRPSNISYIKVAGGIMLHSSSLNVRENFEFDSFPSKKNESRHLKELMELRGMTFSRLL